MNQSQNNFTFSFTTLKTPGEVFGILLNPKAWWSGFYDETINGNSLKINDEFAFHAGGGVHYSKQKVVVLIPAKKVVWLVNESALTFLSKPDEWTGTQFGFELTGEGDKTKVTFTHEGLVPEIECYPDCSTGWTKYLDQLEEQLNAH